MYQTFFSRCELKESTKVFDADNFSGQDLSLGKVACDDLDIFLCLIHHSLLGSADGNCTVICDVDLYAGLIDDGVDGLSSLADNFTDLLRVDHHLDDLRSELADRLTMGSDLGGTPLFRERVLVVEDDKAIRALISTTLERQEVEPVLVSTGRAALAEAARSNPSVMLLDLGLPDMDGVEVIKAVRQWSMMFIIVVSARSEDDDKVAALDAGADDYLTKPFSVEELLARLRAALRRVHYDRDRDSHDENSFENGELFLDYTAGTVTVSGKEIHLAPMEYKLLCLLAHNVGKVLTYRFILQTVWGNSLEQNLPSLRVFMATLRKKIEHISPQCNYIKTHMGIGYRMVRVEGDNTSNQNQQAVPHPGKS